MSLFDLLDSQPPVDRNELGPWRQGQPDTARLAALDNYVRSGSQRARVLAVLVERGDRGATDFELWDACRDGAGAPKYPHVAGTRRKELCDRGLVEETEDRRPTDTGSLATVWRITDLGRAMHERVAA